MGVLRARQVVDHFMIRRCSGRLATVVLTSVVLAITCTSRAHAGPKAPTKEQVQAAFLYNFCKFVDWPDEAHSRPNSPIVIGVLGKDPFGSTLDETVSGKMVHGRPLSVRRLQLGDDLASCHLLYISASEEKELASVLASVEGTHVLTVSEMKEFAARGGVINFFVLHKKVRFEINPTAAAQNDLRISSKLLSIGKLVGS